MSEQKTGLDEFVREKEEETSNRHLPEVGEIPEDWSLVTVDNISDDLLGGGTPSKSEEDYWGGEVPWASVKDLNGIEISETEDYITEAGVENSATNVAPAHSIIISTRMTVGEPFLNKVDMAINQDMKTIIPNTKRANPLFLVYSLWDKDPYLKSLGRGTTVDGITTKDLLLTHLGLPPLEEQRKIASVLYTVDQAIENTVEIVEQVQRLRRGIMQKVFSEGVWRHEGHQKTQYGTIPKSWKIQPIQEVAQRIGSGGTPSTDVNEYYGGDIPWVKTDDLNSGLVTESKTKITEKGLNESAAKLFPEGTVVFAMYGGALGQNGRLGMEAAMNQACCGIVTDEKILDSYLLHQQLIHRKQQLTALSAGTHQQNISQSMIEKFEVFIPPLEEQAEMATILRELEETLIANTREKEQLQRLKQGLMQDLLSGEVRAHNKDIEVVNDVLQHG